MLTIQQDDVKDYTRAAAFIVQQVRLWRPQRCGRTSLRRARRAAPHAPRHALTHAFCRARLQRYAAVFLQHEYGIFGGYRGEHVVDLVRRAAATVPFVVTLHTVESVPSPMVQHSLAQLLAHAEVRRRGGNPPPRALGA